jgi:hypothetical protein
LKKLPFLGKYLNINSLYYFCHTERGEVSRSPLTPEGGINDL